jgi:hypothetical protein
MLVNFLGVNLTKFAPPNIKLAFFPLFLGKKLLQNFLSKIYKFKYKNIKLKNLI